MANKFLTASKKLNNKSPLLNGEKLSTDTLIAKGFVTVNGFDLITVEDKAVGVLSFEEFPNAFYFGGKIITSHCVEWASLCEGDVERASAELAEAGGVKLKLVRKTSKATKRTYTDVEFAD